MAQTDPSIDENSNAASNRTTDSTNSETAGDAVDGDSDSESHPFAETVAARWPSADRVVVVDESELTIIESGQGGA